MKEKGPSEGRVGFAKQNDIMSVPSPVNTIAPWDDETSLKQLERFGALIEDGLLLADYDQVIRFVNPAASKLFSEELLNRTLSQVIRDTSFDDIFDNIKRQQKPHEFIYGLKKTVTRQFRIKLLPMGAHHVGVLVMDMTLQRNLDKVRRDFVANVSHELRSPLTSLIGFVETMRTTPDLTRDETSHFLTIMDEESKRMTRLIDDLISLSRVEVEEHILPQETILLEDVIENVTAILDDRAQRHDMPILVDNQLQDSQALVLAERDEIVEVFHNLIENAIKYGFAGTPIEITLTKIDNKFVKVIVTNQGEGIEARHIPRLTERFYRVDKARSRQKGGTGLGLAIVKHIVNRHRGELHIESVQGKHTSFEIKMPLVATKYMS